MSSVAGNPAVDPTIIGTPLTLDGTTYNLVFTFEALAIAEAKLRAVGTPINILQSLDLTAVSATSIRPLLYAAVITDQPDISIEQVYALVTMRNWTEVYRAVVDAYVASLADPNKVDAEDDSSDPPTPES